MKLTKSKLKQIIREAYEETLTGTDELPAAGETPEEKVWWVTDMHELVTKVDALYKTMPDEGKRLLTENFEMYVERWKKEQADYPEEEEEEGEEELPDIGGEGLAGSSRAATLAAYKENPEFFN